MTLFSASTPSQRTREELLFERFEVLEELGAGGFGTVLRALDHVTGHEVALKVLHRVDQDATERFKKEFRALVELEHPNLVRLGELFERGGVWAFSMELVPGQELLQWVRPDRREPFDEPRLRGALVQLASALDALHTAGLIHRDIKPANVRVTPGGRLVVLDFGLVTHLAMAAQSTTHHIVGTLAYMAPEQTESGPSTAAMDMYALGVLLYEALTGRLPFSGDMLQLLMAKYGQTPVAPHEWVPSVPKDLEALCLELLSPSADARPSASTVLARLGGPVRVSRASTRPPGEDVFVGRARELSQLTLQFGEARRSGPLLVLVEGESGIGKTALISHFLDVLRDRSEPVRLLRGRCHAFEHVTYKAFDDIAEQLVRVLRARGEQAEPLPESARLLPQLFPALSKVAVIAEAGRAPRAPRTELFDAFRELLALLTREMPLLLAIDDLHWSDSESVALIRDLLDYGKLPGLLILASMRSLEAQENAALEPLLEHRRSTRVALATLSTEDARDLIGRLVPSCGPSPRLEQVLAEARGHPLFLLELLRGGCSGPARDDGSRLSLDSAIQSHVAELAPDVRSVLELVSVAGAPLPHGVIADALHVPLGSVYRALAVLRIERLVRSVQPGEVVAYHDRSREAVVSQLDEATTASLHATLAEAWLRAERMSPARVAYHYIAAGEEVRAAPWLERAGDEALSTAGFERAAELFQLRLALGQVPVAGDDRKKLLLKLSEALASSGRCSASAHVLLEALAGARAAERTDLLLRVAQQLLQAGELEAGFRAAENAMHEVGLAWSASPVSAAARFAWHGMRLRSESGQSERVPPPRPVPERAQRQLETFAALIHPLFWADLLRCGEMVARYSRLALKHGSLPHIVRALGMQSVFLTLSDPGGTAGIALNDRTAQWALHDGSPPVLAYQEYTRGGCLAFSARFHEAAGHFERAEQMYRTECQGQVWMQINSRAALLGCLFLGGEHRLFARRVSEWLREASSRGDAFAEALINCVGRGAGLHLMADQPELALADLARVGEGWHVQSFGVNHLFDVDMHHLALTYLGPREAYAWWSTDKPEQRVSHRRRKGFVPELLEVYRAEALLAMGLEAERDDLLDGARAVSSRLLDAATPRVRARALLIHAQLLVHEDKREEARAAALSAGTLLSEIGEFRALAGELLGASLLSPESRDLAERKVLHWFAVRGWKNPRRALTWLVPIYPRLKS